jgi:hypothetical protein
VTDVEVPAKAYYHQYLQHQDMQTSRVWRWMIWWYWSRYSAWACMSTTYKKLKLVTSQHEWYDVLPTVTRGPWTWTCTCSTSATSVIWRSTATVSCVRNWTGCGNMLASTYQKKTDITHTELPMT